MKASDFMLKIDRKEIKFKTNFAPGTFGWEFDFAEAYAKHENEELAKEVRQTIINLKSKQSAFLGTEGEAPRRNFKLGLDWGIDSIEMIYNKLIK